MSNADSKQHHLSRNGETFGPWTVAVIAEKLSSGEVAITDFVWDELKSDWISLLEFSDLKTHLMARKPSAPPKVLAATEQAVEVKTEQTVEVATEQTVEVATEQTVEVATMQAMTSSLSSSSSKALVVTSAMTDDDAIQWYVTRGQQKFGPFNFYGVVKALQDKSVFEFDYIWKEGMTNWIRLAEHEKFSSANIRTLLENLGAKKKHGDVFAQRRHARLLIENEVLVNDNQSVSAGRMVEASVGGSGLVINNSTLIPGQLIHVHYSSIDGLPAFNAVGEIVSKKFNRTARDSRAAIHYGVRFVKMDPAAEERVKNYFKSKAGVSHRPASA